MGNRVITITQVPVAQKDLLRFEIQRLDLTGAVFQATITYEVRDSDGKILRVSTYTKQGPGVLAAAAITQLLSEINSVEGT